MASLHYQLEGRMGKKREKEEEKGKAHRKHFLWAANRCAVIPGAIALVSPPPSPSHKMSVNLSSINEWVGRMGRPCLPAERVGPEYFGWHLVMLS